MLESLLAEQPWLVTLMLGSLVAGLIAAWTQTGNKIALIAAPVIALLIPAAWTLAAHWQTDREQVRDLIYEIADAVEQNDHERVLAVVGDSQTRQRARSELQNWVFNVAEVNRIRSIDVVAGSIPKVANVDMTVKVDLRQRKGRGMTARFPRRLILKFEKAADQWKVVEYRHLSPVGKDRFSEVPR